MRYTLLCIVCLIPIVLYACAQNENQQVWDNFDCRKIEEPSMELYEKEVYEQESDFGACSGNDLINFTDD